MRVETIGDATLYLGEVEFILPGLMADLVIADPPYGIGESGKKNASRQKLAAPRDYGDFTWDEHPASPAEIQVAIDSGKHAIVWGANHLGSMNAATKWLVWDKLNSGDFADCEIAWSNLPGAVRIFRHMWNGMLRDSERDTPRVHPTQKPIALMAWCLDQMPSAKTIGEPWMGSAPAGCAALARGLTYWGIEKDPRNFDIACRRIEQAANQGQLFAPMVATAEQMGLGV
jgi:site-specific DNA-methyltransferase (adenine-specific)/modification methylase